HRRLLRLVDGPHAPRAYLLEDPELAAEQVAADEWVLGAHWATAIPNLMPGSDLNDRSQAGPEPGHHQSPILARAGFRHAFFTRLGGASEGPFASLSFSTAVGDDSSHVA